MHRRFHLWSLNLAEVHPPGVPSSDVRVLNPGGARSSCQSMTGGDGRAGWLSRYSCKSVMQEKSLGGRANITDQARHFANKHCAKQPEKSV